VQFSPAPPNIQGGIVNLFKDIKFWIGFLIVVLGVIAYMGGYIELPKKVENVEVKIEENEGGIDTLSNTVAQYIAVQSEVQQRQDMRQQTLENIVINQIAARDN